MANGVPEDDRRLYVAAPPEEKRIMRELRIILEREQDETLSVSDVYRAGLRHLAQLKGVPINT